MFAPETHRRDGSPRLFNPMMIAVIAGALVMSAAMGVRQTFGLFIGPFSFDHGLPVTTIAFAIALHNLVWGVAQPFAGAAADRYGSGPLVALGAVVFALGLAIAAVVPSGAMLVLGMGVLVGIGISCTSFGVVLTAVGRGAPPDKRSMAMGIASAGGSLGQVALVPVAQWFTSHSGTMVSLFVLAGCLIAIAPLGVLLDRNTRGSHAAVHETAAVSLKEALSRAMRHRGYCLLTIGFFTCGFQLAFIATHLPNYLLLCHMPVGLGATALALIGLFNMAGSWACGWLGGRYRQHHVLGWLYLIRGAAIALFFLGPKSDASVVAFAAIMGLTWLGTVPLTSGLVAKVFGTRHLGTLFGVCFLSHQIGSFLGSWLGGYVFDATGSYSLIWGATALAGLFAALLHFPINDAPAHGGAAVARA
ncbi:MFS transporter [Burkholderia thailandensis]|nr:MFS transporter [Burkholderia thailandensis]AOJ49371.1 MFS transporter [Burkholderia thailandensis]AVR07417.1 MFS transporter [Burkholderia thailandensis]AWY61206.1 MFS transporter [Burkholderia thailandensis]AWY65281.1 MFS transporter [Burkholderia thailandensis]KVG17276.1 MFS transporter [Burkholderia thailandensis]